MAMAMFANKRPGVSPGHQILSPGKFITGGADKLTGDVIFTALDCNKWAVPWKGGLDW